MSQYLGRRLVLSIPTLVLVVVITFLMIRLAPGDPAEAFLEQTRVTEAQLAALRHQLGLDRPVLVQIGYYFGRVLTGELGRSYFTREPVARMILNRFKFTLELAVAATALSTVIGVPLGVLAAVRRNQALDYAISTAAVAVYSMPRFWVGLLLVLIFAVRFPWFPVIGVGVEGNLPDRLHHLVLPTLAVGLSRIALLARITRSSVLDVLRLDFVRTARSKGIAEPRVLFHHALRNGLIPVVTVVGLGLGHLLGGAIIVETVFVRAGLGTLLIEAIRARDYPVVQGTILFFAMGIVVVNIIVDLFYGLIDPRIRYG